uniref:NADAR domain-containing protein n=1 Tax=Mammaliicoccus phage MSShimriz1 TaxID=3230127 RepID=A0AAU8GS04_9VIRU
MWRKAQYFKDWLIAGKILQNAQQPNHAKSLGRKVKNYNDEQWEKVRVDIMKEIVYDKFSQTNLKYQMLEDGNNREFVESSPYDTIWGVGMKDSDPKINHKINWKGQNLLGKVMNEVYLKLKEDKL